MKYKIIPEDVIKNLVEFLDEIQFDAASENSKESMHKINFCTWAITELMESYDAFFKEKNLILLLNFISKFKTIKAAAS